MDFEKELQKELDKLPFTKHADDGLYNDGQLDGFELGARWAYEKIKEGSVSIIKPPEFPLCRVMREGVWHLCENCGSTMSKSGWFRLFGKRYCDNHKCPNSKPSYQSW